MWNIWWVGHIVIEGTIGSLTMIANNSLIDLNLPFLSTNSMSLFHGAVQMISKECVCAHYGISQHCRLLAILQLSFTVLVNTALYC